MMAGTFALYADEDGGMVMVADVAGRGITRRKVPATVVRMVLGDGGGPVGRLLRGALRGE